jgi:C-terminal processing protease CtpA/Prc
MTRLLSLAFLCLLPFRAGAQSREQVDRLAGLGKVWGFLKYYHSGVAGGRANWDSVLVAAVPRVKSASTPAEYRAVIQSLLDVGGPVPDCADIRDGRTDRGNRCDAVVPDSMRINLDNRWLEDTTRFGSLISRQLLRVRDHPHRGSSRYVTFGINASFAADTAFTSSEYPSEGQRLLALFRFWNAARYYFPYMYVNGGDWNAVLPEFIPRMIGAKNADEYHLSIVEMTTRLHDAHVGASSPTLLRILGARYPAFEARMIDGNAVIWKPAPNAPESGLQAGDVITRIDGVSVADRRRDLAKYVAAGNDAVFERKLLQLVLRSRADSATYTIERGGRSLVRRVAMAPPPTGAAPQSYPVTELVKVLPNSNIGYINMGSLNLAQVDAAIAIVEKTDGLVMDVRNYPRGTMYKFAEFLNPNARPFVTFAYVDSTYPGLVSWMQFAQLAGKGSGNANAYRGRVAILVDERTQSHAEFTTMALRTSPQNKVIGSQTAGADGNVTFLTLPGSIRTVFTGLGVYYPDGRKTQRVGIVPDIEIRPTLKGLRAGRDEVLERALEYIRTGR